MRNGRAQRIQWKAVLAIAAGAALAVLSWPVLRAVVALVAGGVNVAVLAFV